MQPEELAGNVDRVVELSSFCAVFKELKEVDADAASNIENSIRQLMNEIHREMQEVRSNPDRLAFLLYRESVELKAHASAYLRYSEMMASYEARLLRFSSIALEAFFDHLFDALGDYFSSKREVISQEVEERFKWYTGLRDTGKKGVGTLLNLGVKGLRKGLEEAYKKTGGQIADSTQPDRKVLDDSTLLEEVFRKYLSSETLHHDIGSIIEASARILEDGWKKEVKGLTLDMADLRAFSRQEKLQMEHHFAFELGYSEQAFTVGVGGAAAATVGLAAGWHTISYALINVFPWAAAFAVVATVAAGVLTKQRSIDKRKAQVREAVENLYRQFLSIINLQPIPELGNKTLRHALSEKLRGMVDELQQKWNQTIAGKLDVGHYRKLNAAITQHLLLIQDCLEALKAVPQVDRGP